MKFPITTVMRPVVIGGILLIALGTFGVVKGFHFHSQGSYKVGPFHGPVQAQSELPWWVAGVVIVAGVLLIVAGSRKKS
jgi:hypothetical protein